ncbi:MAG: leucyl aminopeptidase family protein, partial [Pseudomonadota bacterium]|nr:leucyl aminopeptidase family protein [Pseudomonadota bacterium]
MTTPTGFATLLDSAAPRAMHLVQRSGLSAWRDAQSAPVQAWLDAQQYDASAGSVMTLPDTEGGLAGAVIGIGDPLDPLSYAHAPLALPAGDWKAASAVDADARNALQLGWGLGSYRFTRYKAAARAPARLVGEFEDAVFDVLAACVRVRDLVNTPTEHMGPDELEAVARDIANAHGGSIHVTTGDDLLTQNYPAIHAVGRASHRAPRLIEMTWGDAAHPHIAIVG